MRHCSLLSLALALVTVGACSPSAYMRGTTRLQSGDFPGALELLSAAIEADPTNVGAVLNRGIAYANMDLVDEALADYARAVELQPSLAEAWYRSGVAHASRGDHELAVADFDLAVECKDTVVRDAQGHAIGTDAALIYFDRGASLYRLDRFEESIDSFDRAIVVSPRFATAYNSRGIVYARLGDKTSACRDRVHACELGLKAACEWAALHCE